MSRSNGFLPPFAGEVARTKCATKGATRVEMLEKCLALTNPSTWSFPCVQSPPIPERVRLKLDVNP